MVVSAMPPKKATTTCVALKGCKRAPAMKSQRKKIVEGVPMKSVAAINRVPAKKLPAAVANRMGWLSRAARDDEDGPWDSTSMYVDADSINQIAERNHAQWLRDCRRMMKQESEQKLESMKEEMDACPANR